MYSCLQIKGTDVLYYLYIKPVAVMEVLICGQLFVHSPNPGQSVKIYSYVA